MYLDVLCFIYLGILFDDYMFYINNVINFPIYNKNWISCLSPLKHWNYVAEEWMEGMEGAKTGFWMESVVLSLFMWSSVFDE